MLKKQLIILIALVCLLSAGCAINPVTGENQLMLVSEAQELQIGRQYAPEVEKQLGRANRKLAVAKTILKWAFGAKESHV